MSPFPKGLHWTSHRAFVLAPVVLLVSLALCLHPSTAADSSAGDPATSSSRSSATRDDSDGDASVLEHSIFSWDFSHELGSLTWWNEWFPACKSRYQGPVRIGWENGITESDDTLVIERVTGLPILPMEAVVAYNSTFNVVRCDMSAGAVRFHVYWAPRDESQPVDKGPPFKLEQLSFMFPSEHEFEDGLVDAEIRYTFTSTGTFPLSEETVLDSVIDETTTVSFSILLKEVRDDGGSAAMELLLAQVMEGYDTGVTRLTPYFPPFDKGLVHYKGSMTAPPCRGNVQHFVGTTLFPVEMSTLQKFRMYGPNWKDYRSNVDPDGRPVRRVAFNPNGLVPALRKEAYVAPYVIYRQDDKLREELRRLALQYGAIEAGALVALLVVVMALLTWQRVTYRVPFSITWRLPGHGREVFGVPLRYGEETGQPKPSEQLADMVVPSPTASVVGGEHESEEDEERDRDTTSLPRPPSSGTNPRHPMGDLLSGIVQPTKKR